MSLIYQALKQTEQEAPAAVVASASVAAAPRAVPVVPPAASGRLRGPLLLGALVAGGGIVAGLLLSQREPVAEVAANAGPSAPAAVAPAPADMPPLPTAPVAPLPVAAPAVSQAPAPGALATLPVAELPLPTVPPRLTLSTSLSVRPAAAATDSMPAVGPPPAPAPAAAPASAQPVSQARPAPVEVTVRSTGGATEGASNEDISELFDGLNRALEARDEAQALRHLQGIRNRLPEGSLARLRAEGWHAYRTGDAERAQRVYRRLLEKLPGDENASLTLASIERQGQRPDQAREVLARSLRHNPNSAVLRAALDQANQSEAAR